MYKDGIKLVQQLGSSHTVFIHNSLNLFLTSSVLNPNAGGNVSNYSADAEMQSPLVKKFIALSESQRDEYHMYNGIPYEKIAIVPNAIDPACFQAIDEDHVPDHSILWSSSYNRGAKILIDYVAPIVRMKIPDFNVKIAMPSYCKD